MRWRAKPWMKEKIQQFYGDWIIDDLCVAKTNYFAKEKPLWLEIGTGRGRFINGMAQLYPEIDFLGVERVTGVIYRAVEAAEASGIENLMFVNRDVADVFGWLGEASVERIFLNFSDPWPKNRHEKKRLTHAKMLTKYRKLLASGGDVVFKTDNEALFFWSLEQFVAQGMNINFVSYDWHNDKEYQSTIDVMTEYEERFSALGQRIFRAVADFESVDCENMA